jgi:lambda family phage tail tape measure protein
MTIDVSTLQLVVDTSQVDTAKGKLAELAAQGGATEKSLGGISAGVQSAAADVQVAVAQAQAGYTDLTTLADAYAQATANVYAAEGAERAASEKEILDEILTMRASMDADSVAIAIAASRSQQAAINAGYQEQAQAAREMYDEIDARAIESSLAQRAATQAAYDAILAEGAGATAGAQAGTAESHFPSTMGGAGPSTEGVTTDAEHEADLARDAYMAEAQAAIQAQAAVAGVTAASEAGASGAKPLADAVDNVGKSFTLNSRQSREFGSSIDGLVTGNFARAETSGLAFANSFGLLGAIFTPVGLSIAAVAAATIGLTAAVVIGERDQEEYNAQLALTGNAANLSYVQLEKMAGSIAGGNVTIGAAIETLTKLAESGKYTSTEIEEIGKAATNVAAATGESVDSIIAQYAKLAQDPTKNILELNTNLGFLTDAEYTYIKSLQDVGDTQAAAAEAIKDYSDAQNKALDNAPEQVGLVTSAWQSLKGAISDAKQAVEDYGNTGAEAQLRQLQSQRQTYQNALDVKNNRSAQGQGGESQFFSNIGDVLDSSTPSSLQDSTTQFLSDTTLQSKIAAIDAQSASLKAQVSATNDANTATTTNNQLNAAQQQGMANLTAEADKYNKSLKETNELAKAYNDYQHALITPDGVQISPEQKSKADTAYKQATDGIESRYKTPNTSKSEQNLGVADYSSQLGDITANEKLSFDTLTQQRNNYTITENQWYDGEVAAITDWKNKTIAVYEGEIAAIQSNMGKDEAARNESAAKIKKIEGEIATTTTDATAAITKAGTEKDKYFDDQIKEVDAYVISIDKQIAAEQRQIDHQVNSLTEGSTQAAQDNARDDAQSKGDTELQTYQQKNQSISGTVQYEANVDLIKQTTAAAVAAVTAGYTKINAAQSDWEAGAKVAFQNWVADGQNANKLMQEFTTESFTAMNDALLTFVTTGKLNFTSLITSVLTDLAKMELRIAESQILSSFFGTGAGGTGGTSGLGALFGGSFGLFGGTGSLGGGHAAGGGVSANSVYPVNEQGPEVLTSGGQQYLMTGPNGGTVTPAGVGGSGGGVNVYITVPVTSSGTGATTSSQTGDNTNSSTGKAIAEEIKGQVVAVVTRMIQPGGMLYKNASQR